MWAFARLWNKLHLPFCPKIVALKHLPEEAAILILPAGDFLICIHSKRDSYAMPKQHPQVTRCLGAIFPVPDDGFFLTQ